MSRYTVELVLGGHFVFVCVSVMTWSIFACRTEQRRLIRHRPHDVRITRHLSLIGKKFFFGTGKEKNSVELLRTGFLALK